MTQLVNVTDLNLVNVSSKNVVTTDIQMLKMSPSEGRMTLFPRGRRNFHQTSES